MFTIELHMQTDTLEWLEPLAKHLGHVEVALDYAQSDAPSRQPHPVVGLIDQADREDTAREIAAKERQISKWHEREQAKLERNAERKRQERARMATLSPKAIAHGPCPTCGARVDQPCHGPDGQGFGRKGHTHMARREAYLNQKETTTS